MKRKSLLILLLALVVPWAAMAQTLAEYTVTTGSETYTTIVGVEGTTQLTSVTGDYGTQTVALPFEFKFGETTYAQGTNVTVRSDGYLYFGSTSPGHSCKTAWTSSTNYYLIAPFLNYDGNMPSGAGAYYRSSADMLVVEFVGLQCYYPTSGNTSNYNFQVRLYANGNISTVYGESTLSTYNSYGSVASHNFFLVNGTSDKICLTGSYAEPEAGTPSALPNFTTAPAVGQVITYVRPVHSCPKPTLNEVASTDITDNSATITWVPSDDSQTQFDIYWSTTNTKPTDETTPMAASQSGTSYEIPGLLPSTAYYVWIRGICNGNDNSGGWTDSKSFRTLCGVVNIDATHSWSEGFESYNSGSSSQSITDIACWERVQVSSATNSPFVYTNYGSAATNGKASLELKTNTSPVMIALPEFDAPLDNLHVAFQYNCTGTTYTYTAELGYITDVTDGGTFVKLFDIPTPVTRSGNPSRFTEFAKDLHEAAATANAPAGSRVAIRFASSYTYSSSCPSWNFDQFAVSYVTCFKPTGLDLAEDYPTSRDVSFVWDYEDGDVFQYTLPVGNETNVNNVNFNTTWYAGEAFPVWHDLTPATTRTFWLRRKCGDTEFSEPVSLTFTTLCEPKTVTETESFTENFNEYQGTTYDNAGVMPDCWDAYTTTSNQKPHVISTSSTYYNFSSSNALVMCGGYNGYSYVALPEFTNELQTLQISFKYGFYSYSYGSLNLGYIKENDVNFNTFTPFKDFTATTSSTLVESGDVYLKTLPNDAYRLAFRYKDNNGSGYYVCNIEDVEVSLLPTCWQPQSLAASAITNEGATLTWERHEMGEETAWVLQYGTDNTFATCTEVNVETNPTYTIMSGLNSETTYYVRVKPACDTDGNLWSEVIDFETEPDCAVPAGLAVEANSETPNGATITWTGRNDSFTVEYGTLGETTVTTLLSEDFESSSSFPTGWSTTTTNWRVSSNNYAGGAGPKEAELYYSSSASVPTRLITPALDLTGLTSVNLSFKHMVVHYDGSITFGVATSSDNGTTWNTGWTKSYSANATETINEPSFTTPDMGKANVLFCFYYSSDMYSLDNWYIDDIVIKAETAGEITWHTLNEGTVENPTPGELGTFSFTFDDATIFEPNTTYAARVHGVCGSITTPACEPVNFTTADNCPAPTTFEATGITANSATITWEGGFATEWKVWIKKSTDTSYPSDPAAIVTTPTKTFDGDLEDGTRYDVKIAPTCDETKSLEGSFITPCLPKVVDLTHSFTEDFEGDELLCWTVGDDVTSYNYNWTLTTSEHHGTGSQSIYNCDYGTIYLYTPVLNINATAARLTFWSYDYYIDYYTGGSQDADGLNIVKVTTDGGTTWTQLWCPTIDELSEAWKEIKLDLSDYVNQEIQICFEYQGDNANRWYIDDVRVDALQTFTKEIAGYGDSEGGYYFIASPLNEETDPATITGMTTGDFDLYYFNEEGDAEGLEWMNYKVATFDLTPSMGYLYAHKEDITLTFKGNPYDGDGKVTLAKVGNEKWAGWNLVGNPFLEPAYIGDRAFYVINPEGRAEVIPGSGSIPPMEGVLVIAENDDEELTFSTTQTAIAPKLSINLTNNRSFIDRAMIHFNSECVLRKAQLNPNHTKVYIPMNGKDYAVVNAGEIGEMPVSFKAEKNGTYTLGFTTEDISFGYLHLIDNMTGNDVDLLATPSYTFDARTTDYASRFRLVFSANGTNGDDNFGFIDAAGNLVITDATAGATLQIIDVMGRVVRSTDAARHISTNGMAPGVYMLRLINGTNVKTQKIVVK